MVTPKVKKFAQDLNDFGLAAFSWRILIHDQKLTKEQLNRLECSFIEYFDAINNGYNTQYTAGYKPYKIDFSGKTEAEILEFVFKDSLLG